MNKSKFLITSLIAVLVVGGIAILVNQGRQIQPSDTIRIGAILPLTGEAASYGEDCKRGVELALEDVKKEGSARVSVVFEDSKADPKAAVSAFNKLANIDRVHAILGDMFSSTTLAIAPLAQQSGILLLTPTAADEKIPATGDLVFSIYPSATGEGMFMAQSLPQDALRRVAVLFQNQTATKAIADAFAAAVKKQGGTVAAFEAITEEKSSYRSLMEKISATNPTCVYISAYRDPVALLISTGKEMGLKTVYATQSTLYDEKALADYSGKLEGVLISGPYFDTRNDAETVAKFSTAYKEKYARPPSVWSAYGYDAARILITSMELAAKTGGKPQDRLAGHSFEGLTGKTEINSDRSINKQMVLYRVEGNTFIRQ